MRATPLLQAASLALLLGLGGPLLRAAGPAWPQFRGPLSAGIAPDDPRLPEAWSATENVRWKTRIPGSGWSSPVVAGDHVFVTTALAAAPPAKARVFGAGEIVRPSAPQTWAVIDVEARTGRIRWQRQVATAAPAQPLHAKNSFASETPVTDGERVYAYFSGAGVFALDLTGRVVWSRRMPAPRMRSGWGAAASPVLYDGRLFILSDNEEASFLLALDAKTGRELWRVEREAGSSWVTPLVWVNPVRTEIVTVGATTVRSYTLSGEPLWHLRGISTLSIPTPVVGNNLLFVSSGYRADPRRPVFAVRPGARGDISLAEGQTSNLHVEWAHPTLASYNPSALVYRNVYYTLHDNAFLTANQAGNGKEVYGRQRISDTSTGFTASPWAYNGKLFALSEDGETFVIEAGPAFKVLRRNALDEMTLASPAVADGALFIRTASTLYRIGR